jgi:hypothetical protein
MRRFAALGACLALAGCSKTLPNPPAFTTPVFGRAFQEGPWVGGDGATYEMRVVRLGKLKLPTGRIIATEPLVVRDETPFTVAVPPGEYVVESAIADSGNDPRVAFARVVFSSAKPVAYWKVAVWPHLDADRIAAGAQPGYAVVGGTGSIMDEVAAQDVSGLGENEGFYKVIYADGAHPLNQLFDTEHANLAVFSTGIGDGVYASYFGFASSGEPVMLVSDFNMFDWEPRWADGQARNYREVPR